MLAIGLMNAIMFSDHFQPRLRMPGHSRRRQIGGTVVLLMTGALADNSGSLGAALLLPAACYAIIAYFGYYARRPHVPQAATPHTG